MPALGWECLIASVFLAMAVAGFKKNLWLIVVALAGHGIFDFFHHRFIQNPGVPEWWPGFCLSFDVLAGGFLALLLMRRSGFASMARNRAAFKIGELTREFVELDPRDPTTEMANGETEKPLTAD
jgi:hypothetical protein